MTDSTPQANTLEDPFDQLASTHKLKLKPPTYDGNYSQFEKWMYRFTAFAGFINAAFPSLLAQAEASPQTITAQLLTDGAASTAEGQLWARLAAELQFILVSTTKAVAAAEQQQQQFANKWASTPTALRHGGKSIEGSLF